MLQPKVLLTKTTLVGERYNEVKFKREKNKVHNVHAMNAEIINFISYSII